MIMIIIMYLMMQAQCQPDVYTKRKQYYPASNIYAIIFIFYYAQNIPNVGAIEHGPAQVEIFIPTANIVLLSFYLSRAVHLFFVCFLTACFWQIKIF